MNCSVERSGDRSLAGARPQVLPSVDDVDPDSPQILQRLTHLVVGFADPTIRELHSRFRGVLLSHPEHAERAIVAASCVANQRGEPRRHLKVVANTSGPGSQDRMESVGFSQEVPTSASTSRPGSSRRIASTSLPTCEARRPGSSRLTIVEHDVLQSQPGQRPGPRARVRVGRMRRADARW